MMAAHRREYSLIDLLAGIVSLERDTLQHIQGISISGITLDSRTVHPGDVYFACPGRTVHGMDYIDDAIQAGAAAVLWEASTDTAVIPLSWRQRQSGPNIPLLAVPGLSEKVGEIADRFYGRPSADMFVVGITGTNGKTTCSQFLSQTLLIQGPCGVIGTLGHGIPPQLEQTGHTTPDAVTCHHWLAEMKENKAASVAMEVSSHALDQDRVNSVHFDCAVFTNLSRDHLDYHGDLESYKQAKWRLFHMPGLRFAVVNSDDTACEDLLAGLPNSISVLTYGLRKSGVKPDVFGANLTLNSNGISMDVETKWGSGTLSAPVLGHFNASNLLAVLAVLLQAGVPFDEALSRLASVKNVPGRMEQHGGNNKPVVIVDYAHTPDALEKVLQTLREHCHTSLWCVFGCGGDRDRGKRAVMGRIAEQLADKVVLTNDNPRNENPLTIIDDILQGVEKVEDIVVQPDRAKAIGLAVASAQQSDVILVAGKGHEDYQLCNGEKTFFSDSDEVEGALAK